MRRVVLESPYSGNVEQNVSYARAAIKDSLARGEAPIASHLLYTQPGVLDDTIVEDRAKGIKAGHAWIDIAEAMVVYIDNGITPGMIEGISKAKWLRIPIEYRRILE